MIDGALIVVVAATLGALVSRVYRSLHWLQLEGYRAERYVRHSFEHVSLRDVAPIAIYSATLLVGFLGVSAGVTWIVYVLLLAWVGEAGVLVWSVWARPAKKPIAMTARMWRLVVATALVTLVVAGVAVHALSTANLWAMAFATVVFGAYVLAAYAIAGALVVLEPLFVLIALGLTEPVEASIRKRFVNSARQRLAEVRPLVIGIAGSYGKTTTKSALAAALSPKFKVLASPESYNTLLGVTRTINEQLTNDVEVFIVEMGARQSGDIAEICELVHPTVGILTRLGPQHLEYFKTEENVVRTKTELLRALPGDGFAVVDADGLSDFSAADGWTARTIRVSARPEASPDALLADVTVGGDGTSFALQWQDGATFRARTPLLGRHAAVNSSLAAVVALELGVEPDALRDGLGSMAPVPHRLEVVRNDSVVVIDDAFNSNPDGFAAALEVLGSFPGRRILVTPGMIELGSETVPAHRRIATLAASSCDVIILVGRSWPKEFASTLLESGFPEQQLIFTASLAEATDALGALIRAGDVVLFENDLPDNFA